MSRFTPEEIAYFQSQRLGCLATVDTKGDLHVVAVGFRYTPEHDTIDSGGHNFVTFKKYRDALRHGRVAFVVDNVLPPWKPRFVEVRGTVQAEATGGTQIVPNLAPEMLRITPLYVVPFGVNDEGVMPGQDAWAITAARWSRAGLTHHDCSQKTREASTIIARSLTARFS